MAKHKKREVKPLASRVIMLIETSNYLNRLEGNQFSIFTQKFHLSAIKTLKEFDGQIISKDNSSYLVAFISLSDAILCAIKIRFKFKYVTPKFDANIRRLNIALALSGTKNGKTSKAAITLVTRMCELVRDQIVLSSGLQEAIENENSSGILDEELIRCLKPSEELFLVQLLDYMEDHWRDPKINVRNLSKKLGYSTSQTYRKLKSITGHSTNAFIREFRLHKALELLHDGKGSIAQVAENTGFNSPTYFSKAFRNKYGILPSKYTQQHGN